MAGGLELDDLKVLSNPNYSMIPNSLEDKEYLSTLYSPDQNGVVVEMMYVWNGFAIVGKRADLTENLLVTIEKEEAALENETNHSEYYMDDVCMVQLLKGLCLKYLGRLMQAELCFNKVIQSEKQIKYDSYLVPFTLYELGLLYKQQDEREKAIRYIETAKNNYKEYSMESRLHFRIHAALDSMNVSSASTP